MKFIKWAYLTFTLIVVGILSIATYRLYFSKTISEITDSSLQMKEILKQLDYLENQIRINHIDLKMQEIYPEGYIFTNALYGLTWCETAPQYLNVRDEEIPGNTFFNRNKFVSFCVIITDFLFIPFILINMSKTKPNKQPMQ